MLSSRSGLSSSGTISFDNQFYRFQQILSHDFRLELPRRALIVPLAPAIPTQNKRTMQTRISREFEVAIAIANHPASFPIDLEIRRGAFNQTGLRFAAVAV